MRGHWRELGWSEGVNRWGDGTRVWHLVVAPDGGYSARPACDYRRRVFGQVARVHGAPALACKRCLRHLGGPR